MYLPLRIPGTPFWSSIRKQDEKKRRVEELKKKLKACDEQITSLNKEEQQKEQEQQPLAEGHAEKKAKAQEQKAELESLLAEEEAEGQEVHYAAQVKEKDKLFLVLIGPEKSGKTSVANFLAQEQQRGIIKLDQIYDYCVKRGSAVAEKAANYLRERDEECQRKLAEEAERKKKQKGKKVKDEEPDVNPADYKYLTKELLVEMISERVKDEDCNAGAIFDCFESQYWPNLKFALESICDAITTSNIQVVLFQHYRDPNEALQESQAHIEPAQDLKQAPAGKADPKAAAKGKPPSKEEVERLKKEEEERKRQEELLIQQQKEEEERKKREAAEANGEEYKDEPKPKEYTKEEKQHYFQFVEDINNFFAEIILRQMNQDENSLPVDERDPDQPEEQVAPENQIQYGKRILVDLTIAPTIREICDEAKKLVPDPIWPDPDKEPLPPPVIHQIVKKPPNRSERTPISLFSIWTPTEKVQHIEGQEDQLPLMVNTVTRWILQPKESKKLYIKFFSKNIGSFDQVMQFEIVGSYRPFNLNINAICEFPTINSNFRNVFMAQKKTRPPQAPDSYLSKCFVVSEGIFDFGPLLIGKDPEKRNTDEVLKRVNSSVLQISNNGKYDVQATFCLRSSLPVEEGGTGEKSPFILEPDQMDLKIDETKNLTVYAFPDQAKLYKDEIICLLKDNPNPVIFGIQCLGAKPVVEVDQDVVEFDRLLLEKKMTKTLTLKNVTSIPVKWKLSGVAELPEEFQVSKTNGMIKPCKEEVVEITFTAKAEKKFLQKIILEVEDTEGFNIKQENKAIEIKAEAFKISLDIKFSHDQILDYEAVRVGEPKENKLYMKNIGMYPVKYNFTMKKKQTREIFSIDPMEGELQPNEEKNVVIKFMSQKEIKLRTSKNTSDIVLNILEGKSQETHNSIPINVNVNAVFSKYSITPLKNINFGPMQYGEQITRTFEIRNEGMFEFKFAICDYKDEEQKKKIKEERQREMEERIKGLEEKKEEVKDPKKKPEPAKAPPKGKDPKGKDAPPEGGLIEVSQYAVTPAIGQIPPGSAALISVTFKAKGALFYESTLAIDVANRDPADQADGIPFELNAESSIPGINTEDLDQIFEEQTVVPSLDPTQNTQTVITSSIFSIQERLFWFGTLIAAKNTEGAKERFKIMNPNKIPCTVKFAVKPRSQSKSEGFAFDVKPDILQIEPHKHKYVTVGFYPTSMMTYGGIFEAIVENGDPQSKTGKLVFELRGEGTLPTLQVEKPKEMEADGTPLLKFRKTRIGRESVLSIVLKNEGSIAATARFDVVKNDCFNFMGNLNHTITPKTYQAFDIRFSPKTSSVEKFLLTFNTLHNPFEQHKVMIIGEGYQENVTFEGLPENMEDELLLGDCIVNKAKSATFYLVNNGDKAVKFRWNQGDKDEFKFYPSVGHIKAGTSKQIKVIFKSLKTVKYDKIDLQCETFCIEQKPDPETGAKYRDWDDTMKTMRMVRPSEYRKIMKQREDEERKRKEEAEAAALAAQKGAKGGAKPPAKPAGKGQEEKVEEIAIDMSEEPTMELVETIQETEYSKVEGTDRNVPLKTSLVCDNVKYDCQVNHIDFKPTLMYASRSYKFTIKNTSLITLNYNFKIVNSETGILDAGPYSIIPKKGSISAGCDDNFIVKFSPVEIEDDFSRILSANIENLSPDQKPLIIECNGVAERPIIHFELPPSTYKERKEKDMVPIDSKYKIIEFESLGTNIKNTKRFMAVNPTSQGYEFEWEEVPDDNKKLKPMFRCATPKGSILSGKKFEMIFEYTPDNVGEHESYWIFKIPSEKIIQHFMIVGRVIEPNVLFETGKIKFGPLLLEGKNREVVNIINQELIPFSFNFTKDSVRGSPDYGDSLKVSPIQGTVPPQSQIPIEILFQPKYELTYNYNLICNVKRKDRPLVLNVKGEGYKIHHSVFADINRVQVQSEPYKFDFGDFFINEKKTKVVYLQNNGEFNFDFVWKRQINKYITITPETGTVMKGSEVSFEITYLPIAEHQLKNYKLSLNIVSGPKYDFFLNGNARKPGMKLNFTNFDFGPCFVMRQPMPKKTVLEIINLDNSAISVETIFEKKPYLDVQLAPGQVLVPSTKENPIKLEIPIIFTPREIKKYQETISFEFNNLYSIDVTITGEGIPMLLELVDPDQAIVDFGVVSVGGDVTRTIPLINKSKKPVTFQLLPSSDDQFKKCQVTFTPDKELTLKPRETMPIEVRYNPKNRMPNFNMDIMLSIKDNESKQLLHLSGVSHGIELKLMDEVLAFGSVVKGSRLTKLLQLSNFGDVKAYYKWDSKAYNRYFTINPESGYVNPNSNLDLEVTFHPTLADPDIRCNKVKCEIKGGEPLFLSLMGKCIEQDLSQTQTLNFQTQVRKIQKQTVPIQNTEDREWVINPTISTESDSCSGFFIGKSTLVVPAKQTAQFEISYIPKTMTKKNAADQYDAHRGSLFFPLPNGTALLYKLNGIATEPDSEGLIQETVVAKKSKFIVVPVKNWLKQDQRFKVSWNIEGEADPTTFIRGANMLDVAGESSKDFKLNFLTYKTGTYKFAITFKNESSGEFLLYKVQVQATEPDLIERIELASAIRESISKVITIENPTDNEVTILKSQFLYQNEYIDVTPETLKIPPKSERGFEISYRPLNQIEQEIDFVLKNPVLGDYKYKLLLKGLSASAQRSLAFKCALGQDLVQAFKFTHFLKKPSNYTVKVEKLDQPGGQSEFKAEVAQVSAPAADSPKGVEVSVNVRYEPFTIGDSRAILKLNSPEGMEYTCLLYGKSTAPIPQGPIKCVPGAKPIQIDFKNPLNEKCEFQITFDNPNFSLASKLPGPIDPGKVTGLQIKYDAKPDLPQTGRMIISTRGLPSWIYYLQGE